MGIYDRDYYRGDGAGRFSGGRSIVTTLVIINFVVFVLDYLSPRMPDGTHWLSDTLALKSDLFTHPWNFWQLLTAGFVHSSFDSSRYLHIFVNMLALWMLGRDVEQKYGGQEFLRIYLSLLVLSSLAWVTLASASGTNASLVGASGGVTGIVMLFILNYPKRSLMIIPFPFAIPAWVVGVLLIGQDLLGAIGQRDNSVAYVAHLAGAAFAFLYFQSGICLGSCFPFTWQIRLPRRSARLKTFDPDSRYENLDALADRILEKVHQYGAESISDEERRILDDYSRRMRQKLR
jgi:membrane associated rhomboid family serine protease